MGTTIRTFWLGLPQSHVPQGADKAQAEAV